MQPQTEKLLEINGTADELFHEFLDKLDETKFSDDQVAIRNAIQSSFSKLDYILKLMDAAQERAIDRAKNPKNLAYTGLDQDFVGQTEVHAESFYAEAHRLKKLMVDPTGFPKLKGLKALPLASCVKHFLRGLFPNAFAGRSRPARADLRIEVPTERTWERGAPRSSRPLGFPITVVG